MVVTRFAPSPTGHLHVGGARTALFCWAYARRHSGRFMLRIEDTDLARSSETAARGLLEDLAWLGIHWDDGPLFSPDDDPAVRIGGDDRGVGPFFQAQRREFYDRYVDILIEKDLAYHAFETPEELEAKRKAALDRKEQYRYDRSALDVPKEERLARAAAGQTHVVRFVVPDEAVTVRDEVLGDVTFQADQLEDFVIRKADGMPTYHFAVVVDDELMGVTHVMRGQEHLINTHRHAVLQRALGFKAPAYAHLPLIFNPDGSKMSKRDKDKAVREACASMNLTESPLHTLAWDRYDEWIHDKKSQLDLDDLAQLAEAVGVHPPEINVEDFRASGYLPEVLCNYLSLLGWNHGEGAERFDMDFLVSHFGTDRIGKSNARFDRAKLLAFNADTLAALSDERFIELWREWSDRYEPGLLEGFDESRLAIAARAAKPRSKVLRDVKTALAFVFIGDGAIEFDEKAVEKVLRKNDGEGLKLLAEFRSHLEQLDPFEPGAIEALVKSFCEERSLGMGKIAQPLRVAVTGSSASPALGDTLALIGRGSTIARIERCLQICAR